MTIKMNVDMTVYYRDKEGKPLKVLEWSDLFEDMTYRIIAAEMIGNIQVSTVWLGLVDMCGNYFETAVFDENRKILEMVRYSSLEEAKLGHEAESWRIKNAVD